MLVRLERVEIDAPRVGEQNDPHPKRKKNKNKNETISRRVVYLDSIHLSCSRWYLENERRGEETAAQRHSAPVPASSIDCCGPTLRLRLRPTGYKTRYK